MSALDEALGKLADAAKQLNAQSDEVNGLIEAVNERLALAKVGLTEWGERHGYPILLNDTEGPNQTRKGFQLGYTKLKDECQLAVRPITMSWVDDESGEGNWVVSPTGESAIALLEAPRLVRIDACAHFVAMV